MADPRQNATNQPATIDTLAWSIAAMLAGGGVVAAVAYFTIVPLGELAMYALTILLPIAGLLFGLGLIGTGTWTTVTSFVSSRGTLGTRVREWVERLERNPHATPDPWAGAQA